MNRRSFLLRCGGVALSVPAVLYATACSSSGDDDSPPGGGGGPDSAPVTSFTALGTLSGHAHQIEILCADLTSDGVTYVSTATNGHTHQVTLNAGQLSEIAAGHTVTVNTTDSHPHQWVITKPSSACAR